MVSFVVETVFRVLASITSVCVTLSMVPSIYCIYQKKDTGIASVLPLVCMAANGHVWMLDGAIVKNWFPMFATFLTSDFIAIGYVTVFFCYARDRKKALRRIITGATILGLITIYAVLGKAGYTNQSNDGVDTTLGILGVLAGLSMFSLMKVLHYKSAAFIPIPMVAAGALNNVMWIVYCPMISSWFLFTGNCMCLLVNTINLILFAVYNPKTHPLRLDPNDPESLNTNPTADIDTASESIAISPVPGNTNTIAYSKKSSQYNAICSPIVQ
ncbi:hypothetical protein DVH05_003246 [Phytophthora capsici]|nr:hypothetical protein DVH05_003246 [Phytophthora capsici]